MILTFKRYQGRFDVVACRFLLQNKTDNNLLQRHFFKGFQVKVALPPTGDGCSNPLVRPTQVTTCTDQRIGAGRKICGENLGQVILGYMMDSIETSSRIRNGALMEPRAPPETGAIPHPSLPQAVLVNNTAATPSLPREHYLALLHLHDSRTGKYAHYAYRFGAEPPFMMLGDLDTKAMATCF